MTRRPTTPARGPLTLLPAVAALFGANLAVTTAPRQAVNATGPASRMELLAVQGNIHLIAGESGNTVVQAGPQGLLVVDTQDGRASSELIAMLGALSDQPLQFIINTSADLESSDGNEAVSKAGLTFSSTNDNNFGQRLPATIVAHENVLARMSGSRGAAAARPQAAWPIDTYTGRRNRELYFNDESIEVIHTPSAHTDGDSVVHFRKSDVVAAGALIDTEAYPVIDTDRGGSITGLVAGLNRLLDLAIPGRHSEDGTLIVPRHGRIYDEADLVEYRDMVTIVRDRVAAMVKKRMTMAQVKAARPTLDYDPVYGSDQAAVERFVEAVYRTSAPAE